MTEAVSGVTQRYIEDVAVGDESVVLQQPTTEHVISFLNNGHSGRPANAMNGRFVDPEVAKAQGFPRPIVPGVMSAAMLTRVVTDWMGPMGRIVSLDVSFRRPVMHDDQLRCVALVTDIIGDEESEASSPGLVSLDVTLENDRGEKPLQAAAVVELPRRG